MKLQSDLSVTQNPVREQNASNIRRTATSKSQAPNELSFNGMNGVQERPSWEVCVYMNDKVVGDLKGTDWNPEYKQCLGFSRNCLEFSFKHSTFAIETV